MRAELMAYFYPPRCGREECSDGHRALTSAVTHSFIQPAVSSTPSLESPYLGSVCLSVGPLNLI